jgi:hypothetical protein
MSSRKNLLEAFSAKEPPAGGSRSGSGPTFSGSSSSGGRGVPRSVLIGFGLCLAFALGFAIGRGGRPVTEAKEAELEAPAPAPRTSSQPRSFQSRPEAGAEASEKPTPARLEDSALYVAENKYTLVVEAYSKTSPDFAWATHDHLKEEGFDVFPPVASGNLLLVLVGAAPRSADLADIEARVRKLERDGKREYDDAYRQPIDKLISRNLPKD